MKGDSLDPKALIREAYNIEGITAGECRTVFLDWALSMPEAVDTKATIKALLERHGVQDHPMTAVLQEGLSAAETPRRRGGWRSRPR